MSEEIRSNGAQEPEADEMKRVEKNVPRVVPLRGAVGIFIVVLVAFILVSVLLTFSLTVKNYYPKENEASHRLYYLSELIEEAAYFDYDDEKLIEAALAAYVDALDDDYAVYYNKEEYAALLESVQGTFVGIGVTAQQSTVNAFGEEWETVRIVSVYKNSTAEAAGLKPDDHILAIIDGENEISLSNISYDEFINHIKGKEGTSVTLSVLRREKNEYSIIEYTIKRAEVRFESVTYEKSPLDQTVGVVTVNKFDEQTHILLSKAMDALIEDGVKKFIIDLRDNGGGDFISAIACSSFFLQKDDLILTRESKSGTREVYRAVPRSGSIVVKESDIGKYSGYSYVILVNGNTASSAEILTAVFRDYSLGTLVGTKTFGKGIVQSVYELGDFGGVKFTTALSYPACGVCYHGIGIQPDIVAAEPDAQMQAALNALKNKS